MGLVFGCREEEGYFVLEEKDQPSQLEIHKVMSIFQQNGC